MCSIICCLGKRSSSKKSKDKDHGGANAGATDPGHLGRDATDNAKPPKVPQKALLPDIRPEGQTTTGEAANEAHQNGKMRDDDGKEDGQDNHGHPEA